jgi:protocatechuate 3,4-dioxygenase beta subunit
MRLRWLCNRWVLVPGVLAIAIGAWNLYVAANADGVIRGRVVDGAGRPVPGAVVTLYNRTFITNEARDRATTDADGRFRFEGNTSHAVQLQAEAPGHARGERVTLRLWFRAQHVELAEPLVLAAR